jgi:hypothetical protein
MVTNKDLTLIYGWANRSFFHDKLPHDLDVRFGCPKGLLGRTIVDVYTGRPYYMRIADALKFSSNLCVMTVLHEMTHVEQPKKKGHGAWFNKRMKELAQAGAFNGHW